MDFSEYDQKHKCYDASNKKVLGHFKDEADGNILTGLIGLRPTCFAFETDDSEKE